MDNTKAGPGFLRGEDLQKDGKWCEFSLAISEIAPPSTVKGADGCIIEHPILSFAGADKKFIVGKTNERLISAQLGKKPNDWIGKTLTLYPVTGNWFGVKNAIAVRVRIASTAPKPFIQANVLGKDITGQAIQNAT